MDETLDARGLARALNAWAQTSPRGFRTGGGADGYGYLQLHSRPDPRGPEVQLTFRAELVGGQPAIRVSVSAPPKTSERESHPSQPSGSQIAILGGTGLPTREPTATCESCGAIGTVGRAVRTDDRGGVLETHRFCLACWPEQSARYRARWEEEDRQDLERFLRGGGRSAQHRGMAFEAATWHTTLQLVREIERMMIAPVPPGAPALEQIATEISQSAAQFDGPMPFQVEAFVHRYRAPTG